MPWFIKFPRTRAFGLCLFGPQLYFNASRCHLICQLFFPSFYKTPMLFSKILNIFLWTSPFFNTFSFQIHIVMKKKTSRNRSTMKAKNSPRPIRREFLYHFRFQNLEILVDHALLGRYNAPAITCGSIIMCTLCNFFASALSNCTPPNHLLLWLS